MDSGDRVKRTVNMAGGDPARVARKIFTGLLTSREAIQRAVRRHQRSLEAGPTTTTAHDQEMDRAA